MRADRFERLFAEYEGPLLGFLVYRTGDRALAEDLLADTFERVLTARRPFDPRKGSEKTWLYTIGLNLGREHARREGAEQRALGGAGGPAALGLSPGLGGRPHGSCHPGRGECLRSSLGHHERAPGARVQPYIYEAHHPDGHQDENRNRSEHPCRHWVQRSNRG